MIEIFVGLVDLAVAVAVNEDTLERIAVLVIDLLVDIEAVGGMSYLMFLDGAACTGRDAAGLGVGTLGKTCDLVFVPGYVVG